MWIVLREFQLPWPIPKVSGPLFISVIHLFGRSRNHVFALLEICSYNALHITTSLVVDANWNTVVMISNWFVSIRLATSLTKFQKFCSGESRLIWQRTSRNKYVLISGWKASLDEMMRSDGLCLSLGGCPYYAWSSDLQVNHAGIQHLGRDRWQLSHYCSFKRLKCAHA